MTAKKVKKENHSHDNGLKGREIASAIVFSGVITPNQLKDLTSFIENKFNKEAPSMGVFYLDYGILFGRWKNNAWQFCPEQKFDVNFLQEARVFNENYELKIWKTEEGYAYRMREDKVDNPNNDEKKCFVVDAKQYLWGTRSEYLRDGWSKLTEERGTELIVPLRVSHVEGESQPLAYLLTRNYVDYLDNEQATYVDCRFVRIAKI